MKAHYAYTVADMPTSGKRRIGRIHLPHLHLHHMTRREFGRQESFAE